MAGRPKGSKNKPQAEVTIEKSYEELTEKKERVKEEYTFKLDAPKCGSLNQMSGRYIADFQGKTYSEAMLKADKWIKEKGFILVSYFEQEAYPAVLISYNVQ